MPRAWNSSQRRVAGSRRKTSAWQFLKSGRRGVGGGVREEASPGDGEREGGEKLMPVTADHGWSRSRRITAGHGKSGHGGSRPVTAA